MEFMVFTTAFSIVWFRVVWHMWFDWLRLWFWNVLRFWLRF